MLGGNSNRPSAEAAEKARQIELDKEKAELQLSLEAHRARQRQIATAQPATEQDNTVQGRAELIADTMLKALQAWGGRAVECTASHLLSPPESQFCLYCDASTSTVNPVTLSPDIPLTIHKRMRCSAKPTMSMKSVPRLLLRPDLKASAGVLITPALQKDATQ